MTPPHLEEIVLRLSGRPEIERITWYVHPIWDHVTVTGPGTVLRCVPTGHYEGNYEVWVPSGRIDDWPPTKSEDNE